ncbi:MAG: hypothetical protein EGR98_00425 [Prevotella sp.]|nr:hypothetical protein [Prevotella sp.]
MVHYLEVLHSTMPLVAFYENVKNLLCKNFVDVFNMFVAEVEEYGYNVYFKVLNGKDYGIPQNRERVIMLAIRKDVDNGKFKFPEPYEEGKTFNDLLDDCSQCGLRNIQRNLSLGSCPRTSKQHQRKGHCCGFCFL